jgi:hypothetical protein
MEGKMHARNVSESMIKMNFTEILKYFEVPERQISPLSPSFI